MILCTQSVLKLEIFQPQPPEGWDCRQGPPHDAINIRAWKIVGLFKRKGCQRQDRFCGHPPVFLGAPPEFLSFLVGPDSYPRGTE